MVAEKPKGSLMALLSNAAGRVFAKAKRENTFFFYSLSVLMLQAAVMFAALFTLPFVSPEQMGIWQTLTVVITFGEILNLGLIRGLNRELPFLLGRGEQEKALALAATTQFYTLATGLAGGALMFAAAALNLGRSGDWVLGLAGMGVYWATAVYRSYLGVTFRSHSEFRRITTVQYIECALTLVTLVLVVVAGYDGMVVRYVLLSVVMTVLLYRVRPIRVRSRFSKSDFVALLSTGIPQYISGYLIATSLSFGQVILLQTGSVGLVGLYTPIAAVASIMMAIRSSVFLYINPRMIFQLGKSNDPRGVLRSIMISGLIIGAIALPIAAVGAAVGPSLIEQLFPEYTAVIDVLAISLIGGLFLGADTTLGGLYALKSWRYTMLYAVLSLVLRGIIPWVWVQNDGALTGVVLGTAAANILILAIGFVLLYLATRRALQQPVSKSPSSPVLIPVDEVGS